MDHRLITIANLLQILAFSMADKGIKSNLEALSNNDFYTIIFYICHDSVNSKGLFIVRTRLPPRVYSLSP